MLHSFGADGSFPSSVIRDAAGNLYGNTQQGGGPANAGIVYKLDPAGNETILHTFTGGADGGFPYAGLTLDAAGNLYGTTTSGGAGCSCGLVFRLDPAGNETVLHSFTGRPDGRYIDSGVIRDAAGNLYGIARDGGTADVGVVFKLDPAGNQTVLYTFTGGPGYGPVAGVAGDDAGNLYGTTEFGGPANAGSVYKIDSTGRLSVLYSFGGVHGSRPLGA